MLFSPEQNLSRYLESIRRYPMLSARKEVALARLWRREEDSDALNQLITSHLRLSAKIAIGYRGYGLPVAELISEGNVGMMHAVRRFDPERGFRFATYAMWWIRASIQEYILRSWSLVKLGTTASQKKLFFNLKKVKAEIQALEEGDLYPEHAKSIANRLNVPEKDVISMNRRLMGEDNSLNVAINADGSGDVEWQDLLKSERESQEELVVKKQIRTHRRKLVRNALGSLSERERLVLFERRLKDAPTTLQVLSNCLGISRERVRQIEVKAFEKLSKAVQNAALNPGLVSTI